MIRVLTVLLVSCTALSCVTEIKIKRKVEIQPKKGEILIKLAHTKDRVERKDRVVVAVIDTGFKEIKYSKQVDICDEGNIDLVNHRNDTWMTDNHGHGTHIAGLIAKNAKVPYCVMVIKYYDPLVNDGQNLGRTIAAFRHAIDMGADVINYSGGGLDPDPREEALVLEALNKGIIVVAAAGNEGMSFTEQTYYPAMYDNRIIVVGNLEMSDKGKAVRAPTSNWGEQVDLQVLGTDIRSINGEMTGTSQSTAIVTGRILEHVKSHKVTKMVMEYEGSSTDSYYLPLYDYTKP